MEAPRRDDNVEAITESLRHKVIEKWGEERAAALAGIIEQTAGDIWRVERHPPALDEPPEANT